MIRAWALTAVLSACHRAGSAAGAEDGTTPEGCDAAIECVRAGARLEASHAFARAAVLYANGCDGGSGEGCRQLSRLAFAGLGVVRDVARGLELEQRACALNDGVACAIQAERYWTATGVYPSEPRARELYARAADLLDAACAGGSGEACSRLGVVFTNGWGLRADLTRAEAAYRSGAGLDAKACEAKEGLACARLAAAKRKGRGVPQDDAASRVSFERACALGVAAACAELGRDADLGRALEVECSEGACAQSCARAAEVFDKLSDAKRAAELYAKACTLGHGASCERREDAKSAEHAYRDACERGDGSACTSLAGRLQDAAEVEATLQRGCDLADAAACLLLGELLKTGSGVLARDEGRARTVFEKACNLGKKAGCDNATGPALGR